MEKFSKAVLLTIRNGIKELYVIFAAFCAFIGILILMGVMGHIGFISALHGCLWPPRTKFILIVL
ncbi:MAG: hypothetical protein CME59_16045 [Halioglobus sp.]|nr:hypothetical protein [Halioglobus sp.]|tara:strand:- start:2448 stop:2642 length:195 start_codon:yes stop_codon:yes gene_type:complete